MISHYICTVFFISIYVSYLLNCLSFSSKHYLKNLHAFLSYLDLISYLILTQFFVNNRVFYDFKIR